VSGYWTHQARATQLRELQKFHDTFSIWSSANEEYRYSSSCTITGTGCNGIHTYIHIHIAVHCIQYNKLAVHCSVSWTYS
jgi:hypothetical protein